MWLFGVHLLPQFTSLAYGFLGVQRMIHLLLIVVQMYGNKMCSLVSLNMASEDWASSESEGRFRVMLLAMDEPY